MESNAKHLLLLAEDDAGIRNLVKIVSVLQLQGLHCCPVIDHDCLAAHSDGLISTAGNMVAEVLS